MDMVTRERCIFPFDESSLNSSATSCRTSSQSLTITTDSCSQESDAQGSSDGGVALEASPVGSPSHLPPEEVDLYVNITKTVALKAPRDSTAEHIKALIQDKEQIDDEYSQQLSFGGRPLKNGKRLVDYGILVYTTIHVILQNSAKMTVNVVVDSEKLASLKSMIQVKEGILPDEFNLFFSGEVLAEDRTLAWLDLPPQPTFYLVLNTKDHLTIIVDMSSRRVTVDAKLWFPVGYV